VPGAFHDNAIPAAAAAAALSTRQYWNFHSRRPRSDLPTWPTAFFSFVPVQSFSFTSQHPTLYYYTKSSSRFLAPFLFWDWFSSDTLRPPFGSHIRCLGDHLLALSGERIVFSCDGFNNTCPGLTRASKPSPCGTGPDSAHPRHLHLATSLQASLSGQHRFYFLAISPESPFFHTGPRKSLRGSCLSPSRAGIHC
jgi:hypothetical protein